jgi:tetratricopeptide (TPR) repeat protein
LLAHAQPGDYPNGRGIKRVKKVAIIAGVVLAAGVLAWPMARGAWAVSRAKVAQQQGDCDGVLKALDGIDPPPAADARFVYEVRAYCLIKAKAWAQAQRAATSALELEPGSVQALSFRFAAARELGETAAAEEDLGRLVQLEPKVARWHEARALLRAARNAWEDAIEDAAFVLAEAPQHTGMLNVRMHAWHALGNWELAYRDADALATLVPGRVTHQDAADLAIPIHRLDDADSHIAAALAEAPDDVGVNVLACRVRIAHAEEPDAGATETDAALRECEHALKVAPKSGPTLRRVARMLKRKGDLDGAAGRIAEAVAAEPSSVLAKDLQAELLLALQKPAEALAAVDAGLAGLNDDPEVIPQAAEAGLRQTRADVLTALGRKADARADLEKALTLLEPDDEDVPKVKQKLAALPVRP